jgi:hypothetical protein
MKTGEVRSGWFRWRDLGVVSAGVTLLVVALAVPPARAADTGSNQSTVYVPPEPIRSVTVSPVTKTSFDCLGTIVPEGLCFIGSHTGGTIKGGITVTNGDATSTIEVNGQSAVPSVPAGTPWTLVDLSRTGPNEFEEATQGIASTTRLSTVPRCDSAFGGGGRDCLATPKESQNEGLVIIGPTSSTNSGIFTITTTWTAAPPGTFGP